MEFDHKDERFKGYWKCLCDCGNIVIVRSDCLTTGNTKACGCLNKELSSVRISEYCTTHGESKTRLCKIWSGMHDRCKQGHRAAKNYGDRGISVCEEWNDYIVFRDWALENGYQDDLTIDRIDVNGNYEPNNCRWATRKTQCRNQRDSLYLTLNGETRHLKEWSEIFGINYWTLYYRQLQSQNAEDVLRPPKYDGNQYDYNHGNKVI